MINRELYLQIKYVSYLKAIALKTHKLQYIHLPSLILTLAKINKAFAAQQAMLTVGITGGIGSGKSTVCRIFQQLRIPVYNADERAKALYIENASVKYQVIELLGKEAYTDQGKLNRSWIAEQVFGNSELLQRLNQVIHPAVAQDFEHWLSQQKNTQYVLKEAAIMIESGSHKACDKMILVSAPQELRIDRVKQRDGVSQEEVLARINKQWTDEQKRPYVDFEIVNDGVQSLIEQVTAIHKILTT